MKSLNMTKKSYNVLKKNRLGNESFSEKILRMTKSKGADKNLKEKQEKIAKEAIATMKKDLILEVYYIKKEKNFNFHV